MVLVRGSTIQPSPRSLGYSGIPLTFLLPLSTHEQSAAESVILFGIPSRTTRRLTLHRLWFGILVLDQPPPTQVVPGSPQFLKHFVNWFWNSLFPTAMKAQLQGQFPLFRKWHEKPGEVEPLKAIASLEVAQAIIEP